VLVDRCRRFTRWYEICDISINAQLARMLSRLGWHAQSKPILKVNAHLLARKLEASGIGLFPRRFTNICSTRLAEGGIKGRSGTARRVKWLRGMAAGRKCLQAW
jgi:hypothetical protein